MVAAGASTVMAAEIVEPAAVGMGVSGEEQYEATHSAPANARVTRQTIDSIDLGALPFHPPALLVQGMIAQSP